MCSFSKAVYFIAIIILLATCQRKKAPFIIKVNPCNSNDCISAAVSGQLYLQKQEQPFSCWATVLTMMMSWKEQKQLTVEETISRYGNRFVEIYNRSSTDGILVKDEIALYDKAGLSIMRQLNPSLEGWAEFIELYGPLSLTIDANPPYGTIHALLLVGIEGNINGQKTTIHYIDPADGELHSVPFMEFLAKYEAESAVDWPIQVIHFPS